MRKYAGILSIMKAILLFAPSVGRLAGTDLRPLRLSRAGVLTQVGAGTVATGTPGL